MKVSKSALTGQHGVHAVAQLVTEVGWLFREQPVHDYGIDAIVEVVRAEQATGQLLAFQIKSGDSAVKERTSDAITFRGDPDHLSYWLEHALPVIIVVYDPSEGIAYWEHVTEDSVTTTAKGWKLPIPTAQTLDPASRDLLANIAVGDPYVLRLRELRLDRPWMAAIDGGGRLFLEAEEWINKSSGRGDIRVVIEDLNGEEKVDATWTVLAGFRPYQDVLGSLMPWADLAVDEGVYTAADHAMFELETGHWDSEDQQMYVFEDFGEWRSSRWPADELRPFEENGEVARWRLEATLNALGRGFLEVDRYLSAGEA